MLSYNIINIKNIKNIKNIFKLSLLSILPALTDPNWLNTSTESSKQRSLPSPWTLLAIEII